MAASLQHVSSFDRALQDFKKDLTSDQIQDFNHTTLKDLQLAISVIQKKQASTRTYQNLRRIEGFLEAMEANAKVVEVFLNVNSFVGLIWVSSVFGHRRLHSAAKENGKEFVRSANSFRVR